MKDKYKEVPREGFDELENKLIRIETFYRERYGRKGYKSDRLRFRVLGRYINQLKIDLRK